MLVNDAMPIGSKVFIDTAPLVYFVERVSPFYAATRAVFSRIDAGSIFAVTSPVTTLAECLVIPMRTRNLDLMHLFIDVITLGMNTAFCVINQDIAVSAAEVRARYNITLTDAMQIATARYTSCDFFLTNDARLQRVEVIPVILLSQLTS